MSELRDKAGLILDQTAGQDGVRDAVLATRDGLVALGKLTGAGDVDTVAAMAAASLAAAETASLEVGGGAIESLRAVCNGRELLIAGLDNQYLLVIIADEGFDADAVLEASRGELLATLAE